MRCKCKYFLRDRDGRLVCSACGKPAKEKPEIEDKVEERHKTKEAPVPNGTQIWPPESKRLTKVVKGTKKAKKRR